MPAANTQRCNHARRRLPGLVLVFAMLLSACQAAPTVELTAQPAAVGSAQASSSGTPESGPSPTAVVHDVPGETALAQQAMEEGDFETAVSLLSGLLSLPDLPDREHLQLTLAKAYLESGTPQPALELLVPLANSGQRDQRTAAALGLAAKAYEDINQYQLAVTAYLNLVALYPEIEPDIRWHLARLAARAGDSVEAAREYRLVDTQAFNQTLRAELLEETAITLRQTGAFTDALQIYDDILTFAQYASYRALVLYWQGDTLMQSGQTEEGGALLLEAYQQDPSSYGAYLALQSLKQAGLNPLTGIEEAWVYYYTGQYDTSQETLDRFIGAGGAETAETSYLQGLLAEKRSDYIQAIQEYDQAIEMDTGGYYLAEAWLAKGRALASNGGDPTITYRALSEAYPESGYAATALWRAAVYHQDQGTWARAEEEYLTLHLRYPDNALANDAGFRAGLMAYAATDVSRAQQIWSDLLAVTETDYTQRNRLRYWLGVAALRLTGYDDAVPFWQQVASDNPNGYYGLRAIDQLSGADLRAISQPRLTIRDVAITDAELQEMNAWITGWYSNPLDTSPVDTPLYQRALILWDIGWTQEALAVFSLLRESYKTSPAGLVIIAEMASRLGAFPAQIDCANELVELAWQAGRSDLPPALVKLAHPTAYSAIFSRESEQMGIDGLLMMALARQESQFFAQAVSPAGALGIVQVMPATGEYIAGQLGVAYDIDELLKPGVGIQFGTWYLAQALHMFDGDILAALAGYNAGPGAAQHWLSMLSFYDADLYYELVPYAETRAYLSLVFRNYRAYQRILQM